MTRGMDKRSVLNFFGSDVLDQEPLSLSKGSPEALIPTAALKSLVPKYQGAYSNAVDRMTGANTGTMQLGSDLAATQIESRLYRLNDRLNAAEFHPRSEGRA